MPLFDNLQRASFAGFAFPVSKLEVTGGLRDHVHEYPHSPGGAPEKLGRKLYEFAITAPMLAGFPAWPKLWPETAASLRVVFEGGRSFDLVVPTIGTITAYCTSWREEAAGNIRNGVIASYTFREDQSDLFLVDKLVTQSTATLVSAGALLKTQVQEELDAALLAAGSIFDAINAASNAVTAISDTAELYANLVEAKCAGLSRLCADADATLDVLNDPVHFRVAEALRSTWGASERLRRDVLKKALPLLSYTVPSVMSVSDLARALYGSNERAMELLRLNAIEDPFQIPRGTIIKAYVPLPGA